MGIKEEINGMVKAAQQWSAPTWATRLFPRQKWRFSDTGRAMIDAMGGPIDYSQPGWYDKVRASQTPERKARLRNAMDMHEELAIRNYATATGVGMNAAIDRARSVGLNPSARTVSRLNAPQANRDVDGDLKAVISPLVAWKRSRGLPIQTTRDLANEISMERGKLSGLSDAEYQKKLQGWRNRVSQMMLPSSTSMAARNVPYPDTEQGRQSYMASYLPGSMRVRPVAGVHPYVAKSNGNGAAVAPKNRGEKTMQFGGAT